jgi:hypothetical protein
MALAEIDVALEEDEPLPTQVVEWIATARERIERYWDSFKHKPLPQYVECDFELVARAIETTCRQGLNDGQLFVEWGCGFGVVTGTAALLGLDAVGIEAEEFLCQESRLLLSHASIPAEIWQGNFLPHRARELADDTDPLVSLTHSIPPAYGQHDMTLGDFAIVFAYPWPGEEHFLRLVFDRFARRNALLLMYRGPYHVELYRKK